MALFLNLLGALFWLGGLGACTMAKGAPHEIEGLIAFVIGAILISSAELLHALNRINSTLKSNNVKQE